MSYIDLPMPARKYFFFKLPSEHGAVAVFSLATVVSLFLCRAELTPVAGALVLLWLIMMSTHNDKLLFFLTVLSALFMCLFGNSLVALFLFLSFLGIELTKASKAAESLWWREIVGLSGAALAPLVVAGLIAGNLQSILPAALAFLASVMTGIFLIHACRPEMKVSPLPTALFSLVFWIWLACLNSTLTLASLLPYCLQILWILKRKRPYLKQLGLAQAACMTLVSLAILISG
ncbi:MAG TPA: hypothetical protein PKZ32_16435 [Candidatus Melainabacteria bacterium]|nr:hypothetical protein [Candidatus Melainabacteria bacterium]